MYVIILDQPLFSVHRFSAPSMGREYDRHPLLMVYGIQYSTSRTFLGLTDRSLSLAHFCGPASTSPSQCLPCMGFSAYMYPTSGVLYGPWDSTRLVKRCKLLAPSFQLVRRQDCQGNPPRTGITCQSCSCPVSLVAWRLDRYDGGNPCRKGETQECRVIRHNAC